MGTKTKLKIWLVVLIFLLMMVLILVEPDLSTVMLMMPIFFTMLFVAGVKVKHLLIIVLMALAVSPLLWHKLHKTKPYQRTRISRTPRAKKRPPAVPSPISNNEYEFGVIRSLASALSKKKFCDMVRDPVQFQRVILHRSNRLDFSACGGIANGGLCWWHSRLTRSATYLTVYRPDLPKPTEEQVLEIFDAWVHNSRVVEIPGYKNLREFSHDWRALLRKKLERWQLVDGIARFQWIRGLTGETEVSSEEFKDKMDKLFKQVRTENKIVYQKLQVPGIYVHSWLVVDMKKTSDGYILRIVDSNYPSWFTPPVKDVRYRIGDRYIRYRYHNFVPYTEREADLKEIRAAQLTYCRSN